MKPAGRNPPFWDHGDDPAEACEEGHTEADKGPRWERACLLMAAELELHGNFFFSVGSGDPFGDAAALRQASRDFHGSS